MFSLMASSSARSALILGWTVLSGSGIASAGGRAIALVSSSSNFRGIAARGAGRAAREDGAPVDDGPLRLRRRLRGRRQQPGQILSCLLAVHHQLEEAADRARLQPPRERGRRDRGRVAGGGDAQRQRAQLVGLAGQRLGVRGREAGRDLAPADADLHRQTASHRVRQFLRDRGRIDPRARHARRDDEDSTLADDARLLGLHARHRIELAHGGVDLVAIDEDVYRGGAVRHDRLDPADEPAERVTRAADLERFVEGAVDVERETQVAAFRLEPTLGCGHADLGLLKLLVDTDDLGAELALAHAADLVTGERDAARDRVLAAAARDHRAHKPGSQDRGSQRD